MSEQPEVLVYGVDPSTLGTVIDGLSSNCRVTSASDLLDVLERLSALPDGACLLGRNVSDSGVLLEMAGLLQSFPLGVFVLNMDGMVLWANDLARTIVPSIPRQQDAALVHLFDAWPTVEIMGPDFCPINSVQATGEQARTTVRTDENTFFCLTIDPIRNEIGSSKLLLATLRDTSDEVLQSQKLNAIYQAGLELGELHPDDVRDLNTEERIELLKSKLLHFTQDLLEFDTVEIRVVDQFTGKLNPLLSLGMDPLAEERELSADAEGNGVTGFVAATGRSYLCDDTANDPLYLTGAQGARSSLTVPLIFQEQVLGTFNVESPRTGAFNQADLQFLELFGREVALALNTLDLLVVQRQAFMQEHAREMLRAVADPVDEILNDAAWVFDCYNGQDPDVCERLKSILDQTQKIRELIRANNETQLSNLGAASVHPESHPQLRSRRILVADHDREVRRSAHEILESFGCIVDTAHYGEETLLMARTFHYDLLIADINLPDMNGAELVSRIRETDNRLPVALATGFGYDANHTRVKAHQMGVRTFLFKPFIVNQLLKAVQEAVTPAG